MDTGPIYFGVCIQYNAYRKWTPIDYGPWSAGHYTKLPFCSKVLRHTHLCKHTVMIYSIVALYSYFYLITLPIYITRPNQIQIQIHCFSRYQFKHKYKCGSIFYGTYRTGPIYIAGSPGSIFYREYGPRVHFPWGPYSI